MPVYVTEDPLECVVKRYRQNNRRFRKTEICFNKLLEEKDKVTGGLKCIKTKKVE